jgi:hypothetical protein
VRGILPAVTVPTLVLHHAGDPVIDVTNGRYLAAHIPGARLVETNSADHAFLLEGVEQLREAVRWLLQQSRPPPAGFLATLVTVDHEEGAGPLPLEGVAARYGGLAAGTHAWTFDGPQRAIQCAHALAGLAGSGGVRLRVGVHAGEVRRTRDGTAGEGIDTARAIARRAPQGEIRVSQVVRDLVHGAAFAFDAPESFAPAEGRTIDTYSVRPLTKVSER